MYVLYMLIDMIMCMLDGIKSIMHYLYIGIYFLCHLERWVQFSVMCSEVVECCCSGHMAK
jgi:hypothetical protein